MNFNHLTVPLIAAIVGVLATLGVTASTGSLKTPAALSPDSQVVAVQIACRPGLVVTEHVVPTGNFFVATYDSPGLRYDFTWQENGTAIAVEETKGRDFKPWAEQMTPEFLACINQHSVTIREGIQ